MVGQVFLSLKQTPQVAMVHPRTVLLSSYYDAIVQETTWTDWGDSTAYGHGVIRTDMAQGPVVAHVTLTVTDAWRLPACTPPDDPTPGRNAPVFDYRDLHATFRWKPDPGWNRADRKESRALSGNLAGVYQQQC
jgi:hypothetical protein